MQQTKSAAPHIEDDFAPSITFKFTSPLPIDDCAFQLKNSVWKVSPVGHKQIKATVNKKTNEFRVIWYEDPSTPGAEVVGQLRRARGNRTLVSGKAHIARNKYPQASLYGLMFGLVGMLTMFLISNWFMLAGFALLAFLMLHVYWKITHKHKILVRAIKTAVSHKID